MIPPERRSGQMFAIGSRAPLFSSDLNAGEIVAPFFFTSDLNAGEIVY